MMQLLALLLTSSAVAAEEEEDFAEEMVVWGDLFARWDNTRWMVRNEMALPYVLTLKKDENLEFQTRELALKLVIGCDKDWKLSKRKFEVGCRIEDFAISANIDERRISVADIERAQSVLDEIDAKLTGAVLQLQVSDDGRVTNLSLEGVSKDANRRQSDTHETLRQVLSGLLVGFDLKLRKGNQLNEGKWHEYNSALMSLPVPSYVTASQGSSMVNHFINPFEGHVVVQSIGEGITGIVTDQVSVFYKLKLIGVSLFDKDKGFMKERVWSINGLGTAGQMFQTQSYINNGRIYLLEQADKPDVGPTRVVNGRAQSNELLPAWELFEQ